MLLRDIIDLDATYGGSFDRMVVFTPGEVMSECGAAEAKDDEGLISPAAREAELTLDIVGTFDTMAHVHRKLHKLQHQRLTALSKARCCHRRLSAATTSSD